MVGGLVAVKTDYTNTLLLCYTRITGCLHQLVVDGNVMILMLEWLLVISGKSLFARNLTSISLKQGFCFHPSEFHVC